MNHKLLIRVTAPAVAISLLLLGACLAGAWYINQLQSNLAAILSDNVRSLQAAQGLEIRIRQLRFHSLRYLFEPAAARLEPIEIDQREFEKALAVVHQTASTPKGRECLKEIEREYERYYAEQAQLRAEAGPQRSVAELDRLIDSHPVNLVVKPCQTLLNLNRERMEEIAEESQNVSRQGRLALLLLGLAGPVSGLVLGFGVARGLSRSIYRLSVRIQDVADRLEQDLPSVSLVADGDIQHLDLQLQHIVSRVEEVVGRLQQHQRELVRAEQLSAVGQLAASIAHEVRNPLTGIKLLVGAALRSRNSKPLNLEDLEVIHREVDRLEQTVQGFLNFARLPAPERSRCDLRNVVTQAIELVSLRARQQGVAIDVHAPAAPVPAFVDTGQFSTVFVNLFLNALDAMPHGGRLEVDLQVVPESLCKNGDATPKTQESRPRSRTGSDSGVRLIVTDTGSGIAPQIASRLFTPFTTTKPTGTGLGLTISGRILEEHGGSISASNRPEGGASFVITLPVSPQEAGHAHVVGH